MGVYAGPEIVNDGLVLHLDAASNRSYPGSGTTWTDLSGNGNDGTLTNGPTFDSGNKGSLVFDGVDDQGTISSLGFVGFTGLTINVWFFSNTSSSRALTRASSTSNGFILHYRGAGFYLVSNTGVTSGYLGWQSGYIPPYNEWFMATATWDGSTMKLYVNGVKQPNERSFSGVLSTINTILLGYYFNASQPRTDGKISNFGLYNRALSDSEIQQNFEATRSRYGV